jgi:hypothetical protein
MKKKIFIVFFLFITNVLIAQVGINTIAPNAQLDINSSNQATPSNKDGIIIPKIDAFPATNPTASQQAMMVYLTTTVGSNLPGFYYWNSVTTSWKPIANPSDAKPFVTTGASVGTYMVSLSESTIRVLNGIGEIRLPNAVANLGKVYTILGSNGIAPKMFTTFGGVIYDDVLNNTISILNPNERYIVQSDGTDWLVVGR